MIQAIENKVIVEEMKRTKTKGGIIIPSTAMEPQAYGKIMSIGPAVPVWEDNDRVNIKEGDIVVYHKMGGQAMSFYNKIYCCVPYPEIYGILTDEGIIDELSVIETKEPDVPKPAGPASSLIKRI